MSKLKLRVCAGMLALTLGGIVVCADDRTKEQTAAGPRRDCPGAPAEPLPLPVPLALDEPTDCPNLLDEPDQKRPLADVTPWPAEPRQCPRTVCPVVDEPKVVIPVPPAPAVEPPAVAVPAPVMETPPAPVKPAIVPVAATTPAVGYKVRMEMVGGVTQIELVRGDEVALRVQCDKADVQMPAGGVQAVGKVCVSAPGIDVRCNRMWIGWQTGEISMEGQVRIICQSGPQRTEMSADSISYRLGANLEMTPRTAGKAACD
jgi:hypothetical protein